MQPEVNLGVIPGMGATQRLIRAVGKSKAMDIILCDVRYCMPQNLLRLMALCSTLHTCCLVACSVSRLVLHLPSVPHGKPNIELQQLLWVCRLTAHEALSYGLVSRVVSPDRLIPEAHSMVDKIASLSVLAIAKAKDCVNRAYEVPLSEGLRYEQCVPFS